MFLRCFCIPDLSMAAINLRIATPEGYRPDPAIVAMTDALAKESGSSVLITADPQEVSTARQGVHT